MTQLEPKCATPAHVAQATAHPRTGRVGERGPRVIITLIDTPTGKSLAQVELAVGTAAILHAAEVLGLEAVALQALAEIVADGEMLGEHGVERLRIARERIVDVRKLLA